MTKINWEREPGETVEEFVAALLLLRNPRGNQITPSRGDRGVDIRVWNDAGKAFDVYQVKRYSRPLNSKQVASVENSWKTFVAETLSVIPVRSWNLVMPWNPSIERLEWLNRLTAEANLEEVEWLGRSQLDIMASENSKLVDYCFGDGANRVIELMAAALEGGKDVASVTADATRLIDAVRGRHRALADALNEVDPFYRYEIEVRAGKLVERPWLSESDASRPFAWMRCEQLDDEYYSILRLIALSAESHRLRPITGTLNLEAEKGTPERDALANFYRYGKPFENIPGSISELTGPPGIASGNERGLLSFIGLPSYEPSPDLELRLLSQETGDILHAVPLDNVVSSRGIAPNAGLWISGKDPSGMMTVEVTAGSGDEGARINMQCFNISGKTPAAVAPCVDLLADIDQGTALVLAIRGGKPVSAQWLTSDPDSARWPWMANLVDALSVVQKHTFARIVVPDISRLDTANLKDLDKVARLLRGERLTESWIELPVTYNGGDDLHTMNGRQFEVVFGLPLELSLDGQPVELDMIASYYLPTVRLESPVQIGAVSVGDTLRMVPGDTNEAIVTAISPEALSPGIFADKI